jgi:hypothetical protein
VPASSVGTYVSIISTIKDANDRVKPAMTAVHDALGTWVNYSAGPVATLAASAASGCYDILELLSLRKGTTVTKGMILNHLYGGENERRLKIIECGMNHPSSLELARFFTGRASTASRILLMCCAGT